MRQRRIVVAVDSFKGSIAAADASRAIAGGWRDRRPGDAVQVVPMADGGEGTLAAIAAAAPDARWQAIEVTGPDGRPVEAAWLLLPPTVDAPEGTAVVELAATSGIELLDALRPLEAHTRGFGEAISHALDRGISRLVLALGGSASTDGGAGMLAALGARFADAAGEPVADGGGGLTRLAAVGLDGLPPLPSGGAVALTDVVNPLLGPTGAAAVFGPQKGAGPADVTLLDDALARLAALTGGDPAAPRSGAAGGTGFGLRLWGVELVAGAMAVADLVGLSELVRGADLVITGEGSFDAQTAAGKAPGHVARLAAAAGVPVALVAGRIDAGADVGGFAAALSLSDLAGTQVAALREPVRWLTEAGCRLADIRPGFHS